nr:hypothetical protein BaRGS_017638 [Batillaria attramentaria]
MRPSRGFTRNRDSSLNSTSCHCARDHLCANTRHIINNNKTRRLFNKIQFSNRRTDKNNQKRNKKGHHNGTKTTNSANIKHKNNSNNNHKKKKGVQQHQQGAANKAGQAEDQVGGIQ